MSDSETLRTIGFWLLAGGSVALWLRILTGIFVRRAPLERAPRERVTWHVGAAFLVFLASYLLPGVIMRLAPEEVKPLSLALVQWRCLALVSQIAAIACLLAVGDPLKPRDVGLSLGRLRTDIVAGLRGFLASVAPVYGVNLLVDRFGWRTVDDRHLYFQILDSNSDAAMITWIAVSVVLLAPLAEELLYRVLLQGTCEAYLPAWAAIGLSATMFALAHPWPDCVPLFPLALLLGYVYERRRSYVAVVLLHSLFNAMNLSFSLLGK